MSRSLLGLLVMPACAGLTMASPAAACPSPAGVLAVIHNGLPERLPADTLVLDVEFPEASPSHPSGATEARVRRVVQGAFEGPSVLVQATRRTSCHYPFSNGRSGLIVGQLRDVGGTPIFFPR